MKIQNIWRVLSLVVALFAALSLTFAPALAPDFNLAPIYAEDDDADDDGDDDDDDRGCRGPNSKWGPPSAGITNYPTVKS